MERKIVLRMFGAREYGLHCASGWRDLETAIRQDFGETHSYTALTPKLAEGADPDDAFSCVPYEKGFAFVCHLERLAGGDGAFGPFLKAYFDDLAYGHTDPPMLRDRYTAAFPEAAAQVDWDHWFLAPGFPAEKPAYDNSGVEQANALARRLLDGASPQVCYRTRCTGAEPRSHGTSLEPDVPS